MNRSLEVGGYSPGDECPYIRITMFGTLSLIWVDPQTGENIPIAPERLQGRGAAPALGLLKALLCRPQRFASRDWLLEQFWPESARSKAEERLDDVASGLRSLLRPPGSSARILHYVYGGNGRGSGYRLEGYPAIWVDADAFEWQMQHAALMERYGDDPLPFLEAAYQLAGRGTFLAEELYTQWTIERRRNLDGQYRQCVHQIARLYRQRGAILEAERCLRAYWLAHPTDEDALRLLMEVLGEQDRYQEAEECYQYLLTILAREGEDEGSQPIAQTQDVREFLLTKQIQRKRETEQRIEVAGIQNILPTLLTNQQNETLSSFASGITQRMLETAYNMGEAKQAFAKKSNTRVNTPTSSVPQIVSQTPLWERLSKTLEGSSKIDKVALIELQQIAKRYWGLRTNIGYRNILGVLVGHLETLHQLLKGSQSTLAYQQLCSIASENAQFIGAIHFDIGDHVNALAYYRVSVAAAKEARNYVIWSTGLGRMSSLPIYDNHPKDALPILTQALKLAKEQGSATILAWLYGLQAEALSNLREEKGCLQSLRDAERHIERLEQEDRSEIRFGYAHLMGYKGACYLRLHQHEAALAALNEINTQPGLLSPRQQAIIVVDMAEAYIQQEEIEEACACATRALRMTDQTKSNLVLKRLHAVYQNMKPWQALRSVKDFEEQMVLRAYIVI